MPQTRETITPGATPEQVAFARRRQAIADEVAQINRDVAHWNETHPDDEPLVFVTDFTNDVAEALAARKREPKTKEAK